MKLRLYDTMIRKAHQLNWHAEKLLPRQSLQLGIRRYRVPPPIVPGAFRWTRTWKSQLIAKFLAAAHERAVFVDIGANVGQTLLDFLAADTDGTYFGFEPSPACAAQVQRIIDVNELTNAFIFPFCIHEKIDLLAFYRSQHSDTDESATTVSNLRPAESVSKVFAPAFPLDYVAEKLGWSSIDAVKIDVEGAEAAVLAGMTGIMRKFRPIIISEVLRADPAANLEEYAAAKTGLREMLINSSYIILSIVKAADQSIGGLERRDAFPMEVWTEENAQYCDYLFVPNELQSRFLA
jgi:FkbM family methyltransferase